MKVKTVKAVVTIAIKYDKLFELLKKNGINTTRIRREKIIGQATLTAIKNGTGGLDAKTISKLCALLNCQPGDIMEYVPDEATENNVQPEHAPKQAAQAVTETAEEKKFDFDFDNDSDSMWDFQSAPLDDDEKLPF